MVNKLGPLEIRYTLCSQAQQKYDQVYQTLTSTENLYGVPKQIQDKIGRFQRMRSMSTDRLSEIERVHNALVSEYRSTTEQLDKTPKVPPLHSSVTDTRPMLSESEIHETLEMIFKCRSKVQEVTALKNGDYPHMTTEIDNVVKTMMEIQKTLISFQPVDCIELSMKQLSDRIVQSRILIKNAQVKLFE